MYYNDYHNVIQTPIAILLFYKVICMLQYVITIVLRYLGIIEI